MLSRQIAERYAEALFELAQQHEKTAVWEADLQGLTTLMADTPELTHFLTHPEIPLARKEAVLRQVLQQQVAPEVLATVLLLLKRGHEPDMQTFLDVYHDMQNRAQRVLPVTVTTALPLTELQSASLAQVLLKRTGAKIRLQQTVDPNILAGMVITMGDRVIDASALSSLEQLRESMRG